MDLHNYADPSVPEGLETLVDEQSPTPVEVAVLHQKFDPVRVDHAEAIVELVGEGYDHLVFYVAAAESYDVSHFSRRTFDQRKKDIDLTMDRLRTEKGVTVGYTVVKGTYEPCRFDHRYTTVVHDAVVSATSDLGEQRSFTYYSGSKEFGRGFDLQNPGPYKVASFVVHLPKILTGGAEPRAYNQPVTVKRRAI